jgi:PAS domain S-box-containing protein
MSDFTPNNQNNSEAELHQLSRAIAETASDAIITIDESSTMLFVNRGAEKMFGYGHEELIGQSLTMLMPDYLRQVHRSSLQRYVATGERHVSWAAVQLPGLHKEGHEIPLELSFGEFTENGKRFFTGIARDISERRSLQRRLTVQHEAARILAEADSLTTAAPKLLQAICESLEWEQGQLWLLDREADALQWVTSWHNASLNVTDFEEANRNRAFKRGVGLPGQVWAGGESIWVKEFAGDSNFPRAPLAAAAGLQSAFAFPLIVQNEISGVIELLSRKSQPPDPLLLEVMTGIGHQIGQFIERKRAEEERTQILAREQRARHEVEIAIDRMKRVQTVTDFALAHMLLDELLAELLNRVRDAVNADTVAILLTEECGDELVAWAAKGLEEEVERGVRIPFGTGFAGRVAATRAPVIIDDLEKAEVLNPLLKEAGIRSLLGVPLLVEGRVIGVMHVAKFSRHQFTEDETRLLQLVADRIALAIDNARLFEEERDARREAEAASIAKDEFLSTISHELRTPLTPIIGWVHMIRNGIVPRDEASRGLSVIEKNAHALKRLINDLLDMSAILTGKMRMEELPVHLNDVVQEAVETVRPFAAARDIQLLLTFSRWHGEIVVGDRTRLAQVFWNLLHNAIKFSPPGSRVNVDCETNGRDAIVHIEDVGQGITAEFLPYVFDRFRQADGSKTRIHGGMGLGLALVKSFVEAHHGTVEASSKGYGLGSRFTVRLPLKSAALRVADQPSEPAVQQLLPHILLVEDDADTLELLEASLQTRGFRVTSSASAAEALELAPSNSIDLIISDIGMPEIDGFEMIRRFREIARLRDVPAVALTGYASQKDAEAALAAGFDAHVAKPVDPIELYALIERLLENDNERAQ